MLIKQACKQCYDRMFDDHHVKHNDPVLWGEKEERDWESGFIVCLWAAHGTVLTNQKPPKKCPYRLEHLLNGQSC